MAPRKDTSVSDASANGGGLFSTISGPSARDAGASKEASYPSAAAENTQKNAETYDDYGAIGYEEVPPPDEEITGGNVYFDPGFLPSRPKSEPSLSPRRSASAADSAKSAAPSREAAPTPAPAPSAPPRSPRPVSGTRATAVPGDAKATFGSFLRALRKTGRNGVLFTICMDLDSAYEEGAFVLYTESETIYRSLTKEEHYALIRQALETIGISEFFVRLRGKKGDEFNKSLNELKEKFPDVKIDVK